jgi:hypothetical protein
MRVIHHIEKTRHRTFIFQDNMEPGDGIEANLIAYDGQIYVRGALIVSEPKIKALSISENRFAAETIYSKSSFRSPKLIARPPK